MVGEIAFQAWSLTPESAVFSNFLRVDRLCPGRGSARFPYGKALVLRPTEQNFAGPFRARGDAGPKPTTAFKGSGK